MYKLLFDYYEEIQSQEESQENTEIYQRKESEPKE